MLTPEGPSFSGLQSGTKWQDPQGGGAGRGAAPSRGHSDTRARPAALTPTGAWGGDTPPLPCWGPTTGLQATHCRLQFPLAPQPTLLLLRAGGRVARVALRALSQEGGRSGLTRLAQRPDEAGGTGHHPAYIPLGLLSTNKRAKPEAGMHAEGHGFHECSFPLPPSPPDDNNQPAWGKQAL